jgi:predicted membrane channel-forming protein YqfA (hemolysin III family)
MNRSGIGKDGRYHAHRDPFVIYMLGLALLVVVTPIVFFTAGSTAASLVGTGGTVVWVVGTAIYVLLRDPEGRWDDG